MKFFRNLINFILPPRCLYCGKVLDKDKGLCDTCISEIEFIKEPLCYECGQPLYESSGDKKQLRCGNCLRPHRQIFRMSRSACVYDDVSKNIMLPFKHASKLKYQTIMSRAMINVLHDLDLDIDIVMPVPLAWRRLFKRGYNQATLLARPIAKHFNAVLDVDSLSRKYKPDMGHKNAKQRRENVRGVFKVLNPDKIKGKKILLVDDVMTSGATFYELNRVLRKAGVSAVYAVSFCRVVHAI